MANKFQGATLGDQYFVKILGAKGAYAELIAGNDTIALGAQAALKAAKRLDIKVVGFGRSTACFRRQAREEQARVRGAL